MNRNQRERRRVPARDATKKRRGLFQSTTLELPDGMNLFRVESEGVRRLDFLPYVTGKRNKYADPGMEYYEATYFVHRNVGPNNDMYVCPNKTINARCPVCEEWQRLQRDENADEGIVKSLQPSERQLWLLRDAEQPDDGIMIWDVSYHLFGRKLGDLIRDSDDSDGYDYFYTLDEGLTVRVGFSKKSFEKYSFYEASSIDLKRRKSITDISLEDMPCLDEMLIIEPYERLRAAFQGEDEVLPSGPTNTPSDNGVEDDRSVMSRRTRPPVDQEDYDDDEPATWDDDDDEPEPEPEPKPKVKAKRKRKVKPEPEPAPTATDDDDDGWDWDDE